jgi:anti-sigma-K factor RskA
LLGTAQNKPFASPPPSIKRRLMRRIAWERRRPAWLRSGLIAGSAVSAAAVLLFSLAGLSGLPEDGSKQAELPAPVLPAAAASIPEAAMVMNPDTVLHIVPVVHSNKKGYIWVNDASHEMLILTEGLTPSEENDYQVWFVKKEGRFRVGLLHWQNGMGHLYFRGSELGEVENIAVSHEPKGGSFVPTGPDAIFVNLR